MIADVIRKNFSKNRFLGVYKEYKTTESVVATPHWGEWECIREFVQNALDEMTPEIKRDFEEIKKPRLNIDFGIEQHGDILYIWDKGKGVKLIHILITGLTSKIYELKPTRGEFGEGIKKAISTLLRLGRSIEIFTKRGYRIVPKIKKMVIDSDVVNVMGFDVYEYDVKMDYGTIVAINVTGMYTHRDFTTIGLRPNITLSNDVYLVKRECYNKLPYEIKIKMRANEIHPYYSSDVEKICKGIENPIVRAIVYDEIFDIENGFIAYRDIIVNRKINSIASYNIWRFVPVDAMGRDRVVMSGSWLFSFIGDMWTYTVRNEDNRKNGYKMYAKLIDKIVIKKNDKIELHAYYGSSIRMTDYDREFWKYIIEKVLGFKNIIFVLENVPNYVLNMLSYHGYNPIKVPYDMEYFTAVYMYKEILEEINKKMIEKSLVPDTKLSERGRVALSILRLIVENLYYTQKEELKKMYKEYSIRVSAQNPRFHENPPKIFAFRYPRYEEEYGMKQLGHTNHEEEVIGISVDLIESGDIYKVLATLTHELAHYITWATDYEADLFRDAIEETAGLIEWTLIEKWNRLAR